MVASSSEDSSPCGGVTRYEPAGVDRTLRAAQGVTPSAVMLSRVHVVYSQSPLIKAWEKSESAGPKVVRCYKMAWAAFRLPSSAASRNSVGR